MGLVIVPTSHTKIQWEQPYLSSTQYMLEKLCLCYFYLPRMPSLCSLMPKVVKGTSFTLISLGKLRQSWEMWEGDRFELAPLWNTPSMTQRCDHSPGFSIYQHIGRSWHFLFWDARTSPDPRQTVIWASGPLGRGLGTGYRPTLQSMGCTGGLVSVLVTWGQCRGSRRHIQRGTGSEVNANLPRCPSAQNHNHLLSVNTRIPLFIKGSCWSRNWSVWRMPTCLWIQFRNCPKGWPCCVVFSRGQYQPPQRVFLIVTITGLNTSPSVANTADLRLPQNSRVQVPTPSTSECDCIFRGRVFEEVIHENEVITTGPSPMWPTSL